MKTKLGLILIMTAFIMSCGIVPDSWINRDDESNPMPANVSRSTDEPAPIPNEQKAPEELLVPEKPIIADKTKVEELPFPIEFASSYRGEFREKIFAHKQECAIEILKAWTDPSGKSFININTIPDFLSGEILQCSSKETVIEDKISEDGKVTLSCSLYKIVDGSANEVKFDYINNFFSGYKLTISIDEHNNFTNFSIHANNIIIKMWRKVIKCNDLEAFE